MQKVIYSHYVSVLLFPRQQEHIMSFITINHPTFNSASEIEAARKKGMTHMLQLCNHSDSVQTAFICDSIETAREIYKKNAKRFQMFCLDKLTGDCDGLSQIASGWI